MKKIIRRVDDDKLMDLIPRQMFQIRAKIAEKAFKHLLDWDQFPWDDDEKRTNDKRKIFLKSTGEPHLKIHGAAFVGGRKIAGSIYGGSRPGSNTLGAFYSDKIELRYSNPKTVGEKANFYQFFKGQKVFDYAEYVLKDKKEEGDILDQSGFNFDAALSEALNEWLNQQ
jgi:hypothetical protein